MTFKWTAENETSIKPQKSALASVALLACFVCRQSYCVGWLGGGGRFLAHMQEDGMVKPLKYVSRTLKNTEIVDA